MPLPESIAPHHTALVRIVAGLFAMLGLTCAVAPARISRALHLALARTLRPAESAARRMILFLAKALKPGTIAAIPSRPMPSGIAPAGAGKSRPSFQLFDPRPRLLFVQRRRKAPPAAPRISFFGDSGVRTLDLAPPRKPEGDGLQPSGHIVRRLQALHAALENLPRQARRLVRVLARRAPTARTKLAGPLRPGRAPGFRRRGRAEIDGILRQCDWLAREALWDSS